MAPLLKAVEEDVLGPWKREPFLEGHQTGFGHIVHALVDMAKMFFGQFWCQRMMISDYVVSETDKSWVQRGEPDMLVVVLYLHCFMSTVLDSFGMFGDVLGAYGSSMQLTFY